MPIPALAKRNPRQTEAFAFDLQQMADERGWDTVGYMNREPRILADALDQRGLPGDAELADLFRNFGDTLPETLQRMTLAIRAMSEPRP